MLLYRPVGLRELALIFASGMTAFPPRLPEQPIFYPVTNAEYAAQIASRWNTTSSMFAGYVTEFAVDEAYAATFERHIVGARLHEELWVPAEQLPAFNARIIGNIRVTEAFFGERFTGLLAEGPGPLGGKNAIEQFVAFDQLAEEDLRAALLAHRTEVFLHFQYWRQSDSADLGVSDTRRAALLATITSIWRAAMPAMTLCGVGNT